MSGTPSEFLAQLLGKHSSFDLFRRKVLFHFLYFQYEYRSSRMCQNTAQKKCKRCGQIQLSVNVEGYMDALKKLTTLPGQGTFQKSHFVFLSFR